QGAVAKEVQVDQGQAGKISAETLKALGFTRSANPKEASARIAQKLLNKNKNSGSGDVSIQSGQPLTLNARSALSDALITALGGTGIGSQVDAFRQVNIPTLINTGASGGFTLAGAGVLPLCSDDQVVVTGLAVNPVADMCDFGSPGVTGEVVYVMVSDTEGC